jgi:hypothetical protein
MKLRCWADRGKLLWPGELGLRLNEQSRYGCPASSRNPVRRRRPRLHFGCTSGKSAACFLCANMRGLENPEMIGTAGGEWQLYQEASKPRIYTLKTKKGNNIHYFNIYRSRNLDSLSIDVEDS